MKKRVLIVDDSVFIQEEIKYILEGSNYQVAGYAKDAEEAMKRYAELLPDVVTMDIIMPGTDGLDASKQILDRWKDARIVFLTALSYDECVKQANGMELSEFVQKPIDRELLLAALDKASGLTSEK